jgi:hypothetical protein
VSDEVRIDVNCSILLCTLLFWLYSPLLRLGRFFNFLILYTIGRTYWTSDQSVVRPLPTHRTGIRTRDPSVWAGEDGSSLRPRGHCGRPDMYIGTYNSCSTINTDTQLILIIVFILTYCVFRHFFWVIFRRYTHLNITYLNRHGIRLSVCVSPEDNWKIGSKHVGKNNHY